MAQESWNISLHYVDKNQDQIVVKRSMDRNSITFLDLVYLIEEKGFSSVDYLYYKKKDQHGKSYLIHIDDSNHVTKMILEHEAEKSVELHVFKEKANNDIALSYPLIEDDGLATRLEDDGLPTGARYASNDGVCKEGAVQPRIGRSQSNYTLNFYIAFLRNYNLACNSFFL